MMQSPPQRFVAVCPRLITLATVFTGLIAFSVTSKSDEPHLCDQLAAGALDVERVADAISFGDLNGVLAVEACKTATDISPGVTRFQYQLGRALARADKHVEAQVWYLKAARGAHAAAQYSHGLGYALGRGVPQNSRNAVWWWRKAAEQQLALAQFNLAAMYEQGEGVTRDVAEAYLWCSLAARQETLRPELKERFVNERDRLAATLDPSLLETVELRLKSWTPGFVSEHFQQLLKTNSCARCVLKRGDFRHLSLGHVDLHGAELERGNFRGVDMRSANLNKANLTHAHFSGADLRDANLANANLYYANFYGTTNLHGANLDYSDMRKVRLMNANLTKASLHSTDLRESHFGNTIFIKANLTNANLERAVMRSADLRGADLSNANLSNADFSYANLEGANLTGATLNGTSFKEANLIKAILTDAIISETNFLDAKISDITGVDPGTLR